MSNVITFVYALAHVVEGRLGLEGRKDRGATAVEYGLLVGIIAVGIIVAVGLLRTRLAALFTQISTSI